jgi:hypothetical protein
VIEVVQKDPMGLSKPVIIAKFAEALHDLDEIARRGFRWQQREARSGAALDTLFPGHVSSVHARHYAPSIAAPPLSAALAQATNGWRHGLATEVSQFKVGV